MIIIYYYESHGWTIVPLLSLLFPLDHVHWKILELATPQLRSLADREQLARSALCERPL